MYTVRSIFQNLGCALDERDISMSAAFRAELKERLKGNTAPVPRVFIGSNYLGGFEEVQEMNEDERLRVILKVTRSGLCTHQHERTHVDALTR